MNHQNVSGLITFFYYENLELAAKFYEEIMGFELAVDQKWAKIYKVAENAFMGCVNGQRGYHKPSVEKPVMLTLVVNDPDDWYTRLKRQGVKILSEPHDNNELSLRIFLFEDPEGYVIEVQKFYNQP